MSPASHPSPHFILQSTLNLVEARVTYIFGHHFIVVHQVTLGEWRRRSTRFLPSGMSIQCLLATGRLANIYLFFIGWPSKPLALVKLVAWECRGRFTHGLVGMRVVCRVHLDGNCLNCRVWRACLRLARLRVPAASPADSSSHLLATRDPYVVFGLGNPVRSIGSPV